MFRNIIFVIATVLISHSLSAQFAWVDPPVPDVTQELTVYVDVAQDPDCSNLASSTGPLYMWTWMPAGPAFTDGNGTWDNSNEEMVLTHEGGTLYSITFIPTDFYGVDADAVYENGISFLAKEKDGGGGGDCADGGGEFKTSDINLTIPSPFASVRKVFSVPDLFEDSLYTNQDDIFTLAYNNSVEEKPSMQNIDEAFVYARVLGDNNTLYNVTSLSQVGNNPDLMMTNQGDGKFTFSIVPEEFYSDALPDGVGIKALQFQIITWPLCGSDCAVDGEFLYPYACQ